MAKKFVGGIKTVSEKAKARIPKLFEDIFVLEINDAEDEAPEGHVINDISMTGYAVIRPINVESVAAINNGEAVRVNGDIEISLVEEEEDSLQKVYTDKSEAVEAWDAFMTSRHAAVKAKLESYMKLESFLDNQIKERNF